MKPPLKRKTSSSKAIAPKKAAAANRPEAKTSKAAATAQPAKKQAATIHPARLDAIVTYANEAKHPLSKKLLRHIIKGKKPCICTATGQSGVCLRFWLTEDGQYGRPPGGEQIDCQTCKMTCGS